MLHQEHGPSGEAEVFFTHAGGPWSHLLTLAPHSWLQTLYIAAFAIVLHQAIGKLQLAGWRFAASYWRFQFRGSCLVSSY